MAVSTTAGTIAPGAVVFATGGPPRLDGLELRLPADTVKGHLVVTEPTPVRLPGMVEPGVRNGRTAACSPVEPFDVDDLTAEVRSEVTDALLAKLEAALPELRGVRLTHRWCCLRPHHPDGLPLIDRVPGLDNAWVSSGHYRTGILMGPAVGATLALVRARSLPGRRTEPKRGPRAGAEAPVRGVVASIQAMELAGTACHGLMAPTPMS